MKDDFIERFFAYSPTEPPVFYGFSPNSIWIRIEAIQHYIRDNDKPRLLREADHHVTCAWDYLKWTITSVPTFWSKPAVTD